MPTFLVHRAIDVAGAGVNVASVVVFVIHVFLIHAINVAVLIVVAPFLGMKEQDRCTSETLRTNDSPIKYLSRKC